jgi:hypothetical protein
MRHQTDYCSRIRQPRLRATGQVPQKSEVQSAKALSHIHPCMFSRPAKMREWTKDRLVIWMTHRYRVVCPSRIEDDVTSEVLDCGKTAEGEGGHRAKWGTPHRPILQVQR